MRRSHSVSVFVTISFIIGIVFGFYLEIRTEVLCVILLGLFGLVLFAYWRAKKLFFQDWIFGICTAVMFLFLGIFVNKINQPHQNPKHYIHQEMASAESIRLHIREVLKSSPYADNYIAEVDQIGKYPVDGKLLLTVYRDSLFQSFKVDDQIFVFSKLEDIYHSKNPYQFDYAEYMAHQHVLKQVRVSSQEILQLDSSKETLLGWSGQLKDKLDRSLKTYDFSPNQIALIEALVLGQRTELSAENYQHFIDAGVVHVLAVSGLHVGILMLLLMWLFHPLIFLKKGKIIRSIIVIILLWVYAILVGLSPSILRAVTMFTFLSFGLLFKRKAVTLNMLCVSAIFLLLFNPNLILSVGFQLSYMAVLSILIFQKKIASLFHFKNRILHYFWQISSVTLSAQLGVFPVSLFYFHQFPGLFFITNLVVIPFLGFILGFGVLVLLLAGFSILPDWLVHFYGKILDALQGIINWVAHQDAFVFKHIYFPKEMLFLSILLIVFVAFFIYKKRKLYVYLILTCVLSFQVFAFINDKKVKQKATFYVFHKSRHSVLGLHHGKQLKISTDFKVNDVSESSIISSFVENEAIDSLNYKQSLRNYYVLGERSLFIVDSSAIATLPKDTRATDILLRLSPKINLERLIGELQPKQIIADGSNYKNMILIWAKTCRQNNVPFHYTGNKGAYCMALKK